MAGINRIRSIWRISVCQMKLQMCETRTKAAFLMLFLYLSGILSPLRDFAEEIGEKVAPWLFPVFTNDLVCSMVIFCLWCFLICDAPFRNKGYLYYVGRSGKVTWLAGQMLFLFLFSAIYLFSIQMFSMLLLGTDLIFTPEWGKVLGTLAYTDAAFVYPMPFSLPVTVMSAMLPWEAAILSFFLAWAVAFLLGVGILMINYIGKTSVGAAIAIGWVLLDITINNLLDGIWLRYSPVSLSKISMLRGMYVYLTPAWALKFTGWVTLAMAAAILICAKLRKGLE